MLRTVEIIFLRKLYSYRIESTRIYRRLGDYYLRSAEELEKYTIVFLGGGDRNVTTDSDKK